MSQKIYLGARIEGIENHQRVTEEITQIALRLARESALDQLARSVSGFFDSIKDQSGGALQAHSLPATRSRDDSERYAVIWTAPHPASDSVALYIGGPSDVFDAAGQLDGVREYAYWDGSDRAVGVTADEWVERKKYWADVTPTGFLKLTMSSAIVWLPELSLTDPRVADEVFARIPAVELRARYAAASLVWRGDMSDVMRVLYPGARLEIASLGPLLDSVEPLLVAINLEQLVDTDPQTTVTLERYPHLAPLVDALHADLTAS